MSEEDLTKTIIEYELEECHISVSKHLDKELKDVFLKYLQII